MWLSDKWTLDPWCHFNNFRNSRNDSQSPDSIQRAFITCNFEATSGEIFRFLIIVGEITNRFDVMRLKRRKLICFSQYVDIVIVILMDLWKTEGQSIYPNENCIHDRALMYISVPYKRLENTIKNIMVGQCRLVDTLHNFA